MQKEYSWIIEGRLSTAFVHISVCRLDVSCLSAASYA